MPTQHDIYQGAKLWTFLVAVLCCIGIVGLVGTLIWKILKWMGY